MTRDEKVAQVRQWMRTVDELPAMLSRVMRDNGVATVAELAEKHPKQFNSLHAAIETMESELPEPKTPWQKR